MYFPIGWPKAVNLTIPGDSATTIKHVCCDAVKILIAVVGADFLGVFYANPLVPIAFYRRNNESVESYGTNELIVWKPDSRQLVVLTSFGVLLHYQIDFGANGSGIFTQVDPPAFSLKRDSAELFGKENIPSLSLSEISCVSLGATITTVCCISLTELLIATDLCQLVRIQWSELNKNGGDAFAFINLRNIPFYVNQNAHIKSLPSIASNSYVAALEYSPFISGCAAVFNDRRAAFLTAMHLPFESVNIHGFWVPDVEDATVCSVNHKFRLLAYGRCNADVDVYAIEDATGGLEFSHRLSLSTSVTSDVLGAVQELKWSPDGCVLVVSWQNGGISLWSTFGALLMSTHSWDFGLNIDPSHYNPLTVRRLEWSTEGYQLFMTCNREQHHQQQESILFAEATTNVLQLNFVKSTLTMNTCMASHSHVLLQGDDTIYINQGYNLEKIYSESKFIFPNFQESIEDKLADSMEVKKSGNMSSILSENKYWNVLQLPLTYAETNWPIRYSAIDADGLHLAVAGRTGFVHYSMLTKKWKLFGNESQERDFVVSGGLLWWHGFIVMGCYSLVDRTDEIRCYPEECKLTNQFGNKIQMRAPVISLNMFRNQLIALTGDGITSLFLLKKIDAYLINLECAYEVDVRSICIHPACIVSLTVANLKNNLSAKSVPNNTSSDDAAETIIVNVCGRILMIQRELRRTAASSLMASCLASRVESFWLSNDLDKGPMRNCLWLFSGAHGMRVWVPIYPPANQQTSDAPKRLHSFMSKRIMLSFPLKLYPLVIHFENVIVLGVENETMIYSNESSSHYSLPFCYLERKSQVYLHKILRQLIKRNLGYNAWEIAESCCSLPYFPHSLELLLHEVLEEEATSKGPIPDALLPSILSFIREFPVHLQTIVQCARKTEIALWPHLFSVAGKPKDLFQQCLQSEELETAASFLIILQNLEPSYVSKQYANLLLDIALQNCKWDLAKDLVRFLKTIDPCEIDSPRSSMVVNVKIAPPAQTQSQVNQNPEVFNMVLGPMARERRYSTSITTSLPKERKEKCATVTTPNVAAPVTTATVLSSDMDKNTTKSNHGQTVVRRKSERSNSVKERNEAFCIDSILQCHARKLLSQYKLIELGYMSAYLDFHLVTWLSQEVERSAKLDDFVLALMSLHKELNLPTKIFDSRQHQYEADYAQFHRQFELDKTLQLQQTPSQTSESGYFSLTLRDTPTSITNGNDTAHMPSMKENEEVQQQYSPVGDYNKSLTNLQNVFNSSRYRRVLTMHKERSALALGQHDDDDDDDDFDINLELKLPAKLGIKMRYLLQLFIEANCTDFALLLSILLQDAASIGRIIDVVIRSESLAACSRIESALKHLMQWSFSGECIYRSFLITLQPHIYLLEQYIKTTTTLSGSKKDMNRNKTELMESHELMNTTPTDDNMNGLLQTNNITNANWQLDNYTHDCSVPGAIAGAGVVSGSGKHLQRSISKSSIGSLKLQSANGNLQIKTGSGNTVKANDSNSCKLM